MIRILFSDFAGDGSPVLALAMDRNADAMQRRLGGPFIHAVLRKGCTFVCRGAGLAGSGRRLSAPST